MATYYDNLKDYYTFEPKCPKCNNEMNNVFASGKYDDIISFGHESSVNKTQKLKTSTKVTREFELESKKIKIIYKFDNVSNKITVDFKPNLDTLIELFPIANSFYELNESKFSFAQNNGIINIWNIYLRSLMPFFVIQECPGHFRRVASLVLDPSGESVESITSCDEFTYTPTLRKENQKFVVHKSSIPKKPETMYIHLVDDNQIYNLDPQKGMVILTEKDADLMNLDFSNEEKVAKRIHILFSLKG